LTVKRADENRLRDVFNKYASVEKAGEKFMTHEDFIVRYLRLFEDKYTKKTAYLLGGILDTSKDGYAFGITFLIH